MSRLLTLHTVCPPLLLSISRSQPLQGPPTALSKEEQFEGWTELLAEALAPVAADAVAPPISIEAPKVEAAGA